MTDFQLSPQPGPQTEAYLCPADEAMCGGERGGGKTMLIICREINGAEKYGVNWNGIIFRKKYKDFKEIRLDFDRLIAQGLPARRIGGENQINFIKYKNGAVTTLAQAGSLEAVREWQGNAFVHVSIDEAQQYPYLTQMISILKGCMRSAYGIHPRLLLTGNPGGPGASQIKHMFIPLEYGGNEDNPPEGHVHMVEVAQEDGSVATVSRVFIQMPLAENKILMDGDPTYINRLKSITDPVLRAAWLDGRWDVHIGQAFDLSRKNMLEQGIWPIPEHVPTYMTFDWGYGAPFSIGWWWIDSDGRAYRFREWYGCQKNLPNVGLRLTDQEIAEGMLLREKEFGISGRVNKRLAGPDCFRSRPNYTGKGQGPATSDNFAEYCKRPDVKERYGDVELNLHPGDPKRPQKFRQFRNRLKPQVPGELPMLVVYPECKEFIRTVQSLVVSDVDPEEIEEHQEDHACDDACLICMDHPIGVPDAEVEREIQEKQKRAQYNKLDTADRAALDEWNRTVERIQQAEEGYDWLWR